jgi:mannose-6-phosphate isomerase-like protein (cupin superfamily)
MSGYIANIEKETLENSNFRKVLFTGPNSQLVVMTLQPNEDIGMEVHSNVDQFIRIEKGVGLAILDGEKTTLEDDYAVVIPAGTEHNIVNTSETEIMQLYTVYTPAEHADGTIHATKADALADEHHH